MTALLTDLRALILNSRPAYRDFLGEVTETKPTKILENVVLAENQLMLPVADAAFSGFIAGEAYRVVLDGEEENIIAKDSSEGVILSNVEDISNPPSDYWLIGYIVERGMMIAFTAGTFLGATISVYYDETVTEQRWSVKKLAYELLPDRLFSALSDAANTARKAQSTADAAQSTADAAQSTAESARLWGDSVYLPEEKTITISGAGDKFNFDGYHLIPGEVYSPDIEAIDPKSWDGAAMRFYDHASSSSCAITWDMGKGCYSVSFKGITAITLSGKFLPKVSRTKYRTMAKTLPPYVVLPHLLLASTSSMSDKLYKITVDDTGTLSATEVTDTTT